MTRLIQKIFLSKRANEIIDAEEAHIAQLDKTLAQAKKLLSDLNKIGTVKMWTDPVFGTDTTDLDAMFYNWEISRKK